MLSPRRRTEIIDALRRGTVPQSGLDVLAVGMDRFEASLDSELESVSLGGAAFKAIRGEYGSGKTFFGRWFQERARSKGLATSEVQISETETPLHRMETIYRRLVERLATTDMASGALRSVVDGWFYRLEEDVLAADPALANDPTRLHQRSSDLMEQRLAAVNRSAPAFSAVLRTYREALLREDAALAEGLLAWLGGQPNVAAAAKRAAGIKGEIDHQSALNFLAGLLTILCDSGYGGLVLVLDEVETLQRMRTDTREKGLNALRQFIDEMDAGRFPGLYLMVTGTPAFFDGPQGLQRLPPLAQRLHVDFSTDSRFDNPRAPQLRLKGFDLDLLAAVGGKVRDIFCGQAANPDRVKVVADDAYVLDLARAVTGRLGGKVGIAPRLFLKKLVTDVLDRVDQHTDFDPRQHYALTLAESEMTMAERAGAGALSVDDIELDV